MTSSEVIIIVLSTIFSEINFKIFHILEKYLKLIKINKVDFQLFRPNKHCFQKATPLINIHFLSKAYEWMTLNFNLVKLDNFFLLKRTKFEYNVKWNKN